MEKIRFEPGAPVPATVLLTARSAIPVVGIVAVLQLSAALAALAQAVFTSLVTPAGSGSATTTANWAVAAPPPAARLPTPSVQLAPAPVPEHDQPPPPAQVVLAGTVSVRVTGPESWVPVLTTPRLWTTVPPVAPAPLATLLARLMATTPVAGVEAPPHPTTGGGPDLPQAGLAAAPALPP